MKKIILLFTLSFIGLNNVNAQNLDTIPETTNKFTVGIFQGGGSIVGFDFEQLITKNVGLSVGAGFLAYGASVHYHFKPSITSSSLAINYWHQGLGTSYVQSVFGPSYVAKLSKRFSAQLGLGGIIDKGPLFSEAYKNTNEPDFLLIYSLGVYF